MLGRFSPFRRGVARIAIVAAFGILVSSVNSTLGRFSRGSATEAGDNVRLLAVLQDVILMTGRRIHSG